MASASRDEGCSSVDPLFEQKVKVFLRPVVRFLFVANDENGPASISRVPNRLLRDIDGLTAAGIPALTILSRVSLCLALDNILESSVGSSGFADWDVIWEKWTEEQKGEAHQKAANWFLIVMLCIKCCNEASWRCIIPMDLRKANILSSEASNRNGESWSAAFYAGSMIEGKSVSAPRLNLRTLKPSRESGKKTHAPVQAQLIRDKHFQRFMSLDCFDSWWEKCDELPVRDFASWAQPLYNRDGFIISQAHLSVTKGCQPDERTGPGSRILGQVTFADDSAPTREVVSKGRSRKKPNYFVPTSVQYVEYSTSKASPAQENTSEVEDTNDTQASIAESNASIRDVGGDTWMDSDTPNTCSEGHKEMASVQTKEAKKPLDIIQNQLSPTPSKVRNPYKSSIPYAIQLEMLKNGSPHDKNKDKEGHRSSPDLILHADTEHNEPFDDETPFDFSESETLTVQHNAVTRPPVTSQSSQHNDFQDDAMRLEDNSTPTKDRDVLDKSPNFHRSKPSKNGTNKKKRTKKSSDHGVVSRKLSRKRIKTDFYAPESSPSTKTSSPIITPTSAKPKDTRHLASETVRSEKKEVKATQRVSLLSKKSSRTRMKTNFFARESSSSKKSTSVTIVEPKPPMRKLLPSQLLRMKQKYRREKKKIDGTSSLKQKQRREKKKIDGTSSLKQKQRREKEKIDGTSSLKLATLDCIERDLTDTCLDENRMIQTTKEVVIKRKKKRRRLRVIPRILSRKPASTAKKLSRIDIGQKEVTSAAVADVGTSLSAKQRKPNKHVKLKLKHSATVKRIGLDSPLERCSKQVTVANPNRTSELPSSEDVVCENVDVRKTLVFTPIAKTYMRTSTQSSECTKETAVQHASPSLLETLFVKGRKGIDTSSSDHANGDSQKILINIEESVNMVAAVKPKKRGRPPKLVNPALVKANGESTREKMDSDKPVKKRRGRPPKHADSPVGDESQVDPAVYGSRSHKDLVPKKKRGRPPKVGVVGDKKTNDKSSRENIDSNKSEKKKRGRPPTHTDLVTGDKSQVEHTVSIARKDNDPAPKVKQHSRPPNHIHSNVSSSNSQATSDNRHAISRSVPERKPIARRKVQLTKRVPIVNERAKTLHDGESDNDSDSNDSYVPKKKKSRRREKDQLQVTRKENAEDNEIIPDHVPEHVPDHAPKKRNRYIRRQRTRICETCLGCLRQENCGWCLACLAMTEFGGTGTLGQQCIQRKCLTPVLLLPSKDLEVSQHIPQPQDSGHFTLEDSSTALNVAETKNNTANMPESGNMMGDDDDDDDDDYVDMESLSAHGMMDDMSDMEEEEFSQYNTGIEVQLKLLPDSSNEDNIIVESGGNMEIPDNVCIDDPPRDDMLSNFPVELKDTDAPSKSIIDGTTLPPESIKKYDAVAETISLDGNDVSNENRMREEPSNNEVVEVSLSDSGTEQRDNLETQSTKLQIENDSGATTTRPISCYITEQPSKPDNVIPNAPELQNSTAENPQSTPKLSNAPTIAYTSDIIEQPSKPENVIPNNDPELQNSTEENPQSTTHYLSNAPTIAYTSDIIEQPSKPKPEN
eukprot:scaffold19618_cov59-Attheya_sp.AAC.3